MSEMENPFLLFPVEVWEMILDCVGHSDTVYNLLQTYPQLDLAFQKKKHEWLLGKILPFVTTWKNMLEEKELLKLRLGCKNWLKQVDNFLENQPQLRPYHPSLQSEDQFRWNSKAHFQECRQDPNPYDKRCYGGVKFNYGGYGYGKDKTLVKFLEEMEAHPEESNPFLARSLSVKIRGYGQIQSYASQRLPYAGVVEFLEGVTKVLEKFGKHIWFYSINFYISKSSDRTYKYTRNWLFQSLDHLPNLKSFSALGDFRIVGSGSSETEPAPMNLSFLESFQVSGGDPNALAIPLLKGITTPVRKLVLRFKDWRDDYSRLFSTLTEFKLEEITWGTVGDRTLLKKILSLEAPQLVKLELRFKLGKMSGRSRARSRPYFYMEDDIFPWIKRFPSLKYAAIGSIYSELPLREKGTLLPETDSLPSLQFLAIMDSSTLSYNFLRCLPSLQHLQIYTGSSSKKADLSKDSVVRIREQIKKGTMHKSNIWELLPNLRSVSMLNQHHDGNVFCGREKVNYFREHLDYQGLGDHREKDEDSDSDSDSNQSSGRLGWQLPFVLGPEFQLNQERVSSSSSDSYSD